MNRVVAVIAVFVGIALVASSGWALRPVNRGFEEGRTDCIAAPTGWTGFGANPFRYSNSLENCPGNWGWARSGDGYAGQVASHTTKRGGLYQQVPIPAGTTGEFEVYFRSYSTLGVGNGVARIGYDLNGGTNPTSANVIWTTWESSDDVWVRMTTVQATATINVVTVFIEYDMLLPADVTVCAFDDADIIGGWSGEVDPYTDPPVITNLVPQNTPPLSLTDQLFNYTISNDGSEDSTIAGEFRIGEPFDAFTLPPYFSFPFGGVNGPGAPDGSAGTGTWRIVGNADQTWWHGSPPSAQTPVSVMVFEMLGAANEAFDVEILITDWERSLWQFGMPRDREGVGLFVANADFTEYFFVGGFDDVGGSPAGNAIDTWTVWNIEGADPAQGSSGPHPPNFEPILPQQPVPDGLPTYTASFRLQRMSNGDFNGFARSNQDTYEHKGAINAAGTALGFNQPVVVGVFVNGGDSTSPHDVVVALDYIATRWQPTTAGAGGSGSPVNTSAQGINHSYSWALGADLAGHPGSPQGALKAQMLLTGTDDDGTGAPAYSPWFEVTTGQVQETPTPVQPTPTPTPDVGECTFHTADATGDWQLDFNLALLVIQRFNLGGQYSCGDQADGYQPGPGDQSCAPHDTDYNGNWELEFMEMLRFIQFFNMGYHCTDDPSSPDGYAPGPPPVGRRAAQRAPRSVSGTRSVPEYVAGEELTITVEMTATEALSSLGVVDTLPEGWTYVRRGGTNSPDMARPIGTNVEFLWSQPPDSPISFTYTVEVPAEETGVKTITGFISYTVGVSNPEEATIPASNVMPQGFTPAVTGERSVGSYSAGSELTVSVTITSTEELSALGMVDTVPSGWTYVGKGGANAPDMARQIGDNLEFLWSQPPDSPISFTYTVEVPEGESGAKTITGAISYTVGVGNPEVGLIDDSVISDGPTATPTIAPTNTPVPVNTAVVGVRTAGNYTAGGEFTVTVDITATEALSSLGVVDTIPDGWTYVRKGGANAPDMARQIGNNLEFLWSQPPDSPISFTYTVEIPAGETGEKTLTGSISFTIGVGNPQYGEYPDTVVSDGPPPTPTVAPTNTPVPVNTAVVGERTAGLYTAGEEFTVTVDITATEALSSLGVVDTMPDGWTYVRRGGTNSPDMARQVGNNLEFLWSQPPDSPISFTYTVEIPAGETGEKTLTGSISFTIGVGNPEFGEYPDTVVSDELDATPTPEPTDTPLPGETPTPTPVVEYLEGDINRDGVVDSKDLLILMGNWHRQLLEEEQSQAN